MVLGNLAGIKSELGHPDDEVESLYQRALDIDPTYLFAQTGLARLTARKGDPDHARELLKPVLGREEYHVSEWRAILVVEREIALKQNDVATVLKLEEDLRALQKQFG